MTWSVTSMDKITFRNIVCYYQNRNACYQKKVSRGVTFSKKVKDVLKLRKFQKNDFCKTFPFISTLQTYSSEFDFNKSRLQEKCFLWVFWDSWKFDREMSIMKSFYKVTGILSRFYMSLNKWLHAILRGCLWVSENS